MFNCNYIFNYTVASFFKSLHTRVCRYLDLGRKPHRIENWPFVKEPAWESALFEHICN